MRRVLIKSVCLNIFLKLLACLALLSVVSCGVSIGMLNPKGIISVEERKLFFDTLAMMLIVVLPVIVMSFTFVYHYQVSHRVRRYRPHWSHSYFLETLWWGIPCLIIMVLAILTWKKTYELDPYQRITPSNKPPLLIQVIALPWKWLFIYPQQNIATVNYLMLPAGREVEFWITTDNVPMSAFFIPQLGSQIYAMAGMNTRLHLFSVHPGEYDGMNTQFNGNGFSEMHFPVYVVTPETMQAWFEKTKKLPEPLTEATYLKLLSLSINDAPRFFSAVPPHLYQEVIALYMNTIGTVHPRQRQVGFNTAQ